jgi:hypothetical protein
MFEYFYHEIFRRTIIGFGTLFNQIQIKKTDESGNVSSVIKVPLAYASTQKFLARLEQQADLNKPVQITLPRMSFELVGLSYDPQRKATSTQTFLSKSTTDSKDIKKAYLPVPYNMSFELSIYTKHNDDMLQIIEQILPFFQPAYTLTVNLSETIGEKRDIPIVLDNIGMEDNYEGDFSERRALIYTLRFTAKTYLFGPISNSVQKDIVKKVSIGFVADGSTRDVTYSTQPVATKNYTGNITTTLTADIQLGDTTIEVADASSISVNSYITLDDETLQVSSKTGNKLGVVRGSYNTQASIHVSGTNVYSITEQDNNLIEFGDNFGFGGFDII